MNQNIESVKENGEDIKEILKALPPQATETILRLTSCLERQRELEEKIKQATEIKLSFLHPGSTEEISASLYQLEELLEMRPESNPAKIALQEIRANLETLEAVIEDMLLETVYPFILQNCSIHPAIQREMDAVADIYYTYSERIRDSIEEALKE